MTNYLIVLHYIVALTAIIVIGVIASKVQYKKGQADAYKKVNECLDELSVNLEKQLQKCKGEGTE